MWYFTKNGEITDGNVSISFNELATLLNGNSSGAFEIPAEKLGAVFTDNDLVYINQNDGLYYKAFKGASVNQTQNVMGVYKATNGKHLIVTSGLVENFGTALVPGRRYYLSSTPGVITDAIAYKSIVVGRAINNTNILLDISGDIDVGTWAGFDTTVVDGESKEGIGLTDPDATRSVSFNKVTYDDTLPAAIQFVDVNGTVIKLDVAAEYFGNPFTVTVGSDVYTGVFEENEAFDNPTQTTLVGGATAPEPEPEPTPEPEPEPEPTPEPEPEPEPVDAVNAYDTVLSGTQALNGVGLTDPNDGSDITISFDSIANDDSVPAEIMFLSVNGLVIKLDFQTEYTGKAIDAISAGVRYTGIISVNEDYSNPITLTAV